ncbi:MAG: type IX secretion system membrane protein PorP/SprF [Bacteroidetes bacterium]|nr:type IX secretion system membrane protein PorP/SprF [Bacteroidota bacterium]
MKTILVGLFVVIFSLKFSAQQENHSSNWYFSNALINPAATATDGSNYSFYSNFRMQYFTVGGAPMRTNSVSAEMKIPDQAGGNNNFGVGLNFYNDQTGDARLLTNSISIPINYTIQVDFQNKLSVGLSPGFITQGLNPSYQTWESQWNGSTFNTEGPSGENLNKSYAALDIGAGLFYQIERNNRSKFFAGFSTKHLTRPKIDFSFGGDRLYPHYTIHAGAEFTTRKNYFKIRPNFMFYSNGPNQMVVFGTSAETLLTEGARVTTLRKYKSIQYGFYYRWNDAIITTFGVNIEGFVAGLSFDANISSLTNATNSLGALELYLKYSIVTKSTDTKKKKKKEK